MIRKDVLPIHGEVAAQPPAGLGPGGEERVPKTALSHLIFWFLFAQGGILAAILIPVHVLVQGILGPLGIVPVVDRHDDTWVRALGNPIVKLYLLVLIAVPFFHFAHRIRYLLVDLGLKQARGVPAQAIFYGGAVLVTLVTIWVLLTTVPIGS